jgi:hypothetical protein
MPIHSRSRVHGGVIALLLCGASASAAAQVAPQCAALPSTNQDASRVAELLAARVAPDAQLRTGAGSDELVAELQRASCRQGSVARLLPRTCAPLSGPNTLLELRTRFVQDALLLPVAARQGRATPSSDAERVLIATLTHVAEGGNWDAFLRRVLQLGSTRARSIDTCAATDALLAQGRALDAPIERAAMLLLLGRNQLASAPPKTKDLSALVQRFAAAEPPRALTATQVAAIKELAAAWPELDAPSRREAGDALSLLASSMHSAIELVSDSKADVAKTTTEFTQVEAALRALGTGELSAGLRTALALMGALDGETEVALDVLERIERFLRAPDDDARHRVLRSTALGLGSWADHVTADARIGAMRVSGANYHLAADLGLGYQDLNWGVEASGSARAYQSTTPNTFEDLDRYEGAAELWLATDANAAVRFDGRLSLGAFVYDSNRFLRDAQYDETSAFGRGALLGGVRYDGATTSGGLWLGGGVQQEFYDSFTFATLVSERRQTTRGHFVGRALGAVVLLPRWLVLRAALDASLFSITRMQIVETLGAGAANDAQTQFSELDVSGNLHLDLEALRFFGFVPGASVAADYFRRKADNDVESTLAPIVQLGIHRYQF